MTANARAEWKDPAYNRRILEEAGFEVETSLVDAEVQVKDLRKWCELAWGFAGNPIEGWMPADEEQWDEAVNAIHEALGGNEDYEDNGKGGGVLRMIANVVTVFKP